MATGVDAKLLKSTKFPPEFNQKVDMQKVNLQVMKTYAVHSSPASPEALLTVSRQVDSGQDLGHPRERGRCRHGTRLQSH